MGGGGRYIWYSTLHNFKEPEGQVALWLEVFSEYDYTVIHREGKQHTNADALSRGRCVQCGLEEKEEERKEANMQCHT